MLSIKGLHVSLNCDCRLRLKEVEANDIRGHLRSSEGLLKEMKPKLIDSEAQRARAVAELEVRLKHLTHKKTLHNICFGKVP